MRKSKKESVSFVLDGKGLSPASLSQTELKDLLDDFKRLFDDLLLEKIQNKKNLDFKILELREGSIVLSGYSATYSAEVFQIAENVAEVLNTFEKGVTKLHLNYRSLVNILKVAKSKSANFKIITSKSKTPLTTFLHTKELPDNWQNTLKGITSIYGELLNIGGSEPHAKVRIHTGRTINCDLSKDLAKKISSRLYSQIGLTGIATWDTNENQVVAFKAMDVLNYNPSSNSMNRLSEKFGKYFEDINPDEFIKEIRN